MNFSFFEKTIFNLGKNQDKNYRTQKNSEKKVFILDKIELIFRELCFLEEKNTFKKTLKKRLIKWLD